MSVEPRERLFPVRPPWHPPEGDFRIAGLRVRPSLNRVETPRETISLEPKVMRVLLCLAERPGEVVTKEVLFRDVWEGTFVTDDVLTRAVGELRRLFGDDAGKPRVIETIRKSGYRLIAPVTPEASAPIPSSGEPAPTSDAAPASSERRVSRLILALAAAALVGVAALLLQQSRVSRQGPLRIRPVAALPGNQRDPAVSPDGTRVAFAWNGGTGDEMSLYVQLVDGETPLRLTREPGVEDRTPAWSPDGQRIAFTRARGKECGILLVSALGGEERPVAPCGDSDYKRVDWSPDGKWLALSRRTASGALALELLSPDTLERRSLTQPPAGILGDSSAAFSPDGKTVSFTRNITDGVNDIYRISAAGGEPRRLTFDDRDTMGSAWSSDGRDILFSSSRAGVYAIWRVASSGGDPVWVAGGGTKMKHPSSARTRSFVAFENWVYEVNLWRAPARPGPGRAEALRLTEATDQWNFQPHFSPDGRRVAFISTRSGSEEIWLVGADGQGLTRLTSFRGARLESPRWSPDGGRIVFSARVPERAELYTVAAAGGVPQRLAAETSDAVAPRWSRDGRSVYFASRRGGNGWQVWKRDLEGRAVTPVTTSGGYAAEESRDGRWLYFTRADAAGLWRQDLSRGSAAVPERITDRLAPEDWANWEVGAGGVYFREICARHEGPAVSFLPDGAAEPIDGLLPLADQGWPGFSLSEDGRWIVYPRIDRHTCDIRAIENPA